MQPNELWPLQYHLIVPKDPRKNIRCRQLKAKYNLCQLLIIYLHTINPTVEIAEGFPYNTVNTTWQFLIGTKAIMADDLPLATNNFIFGFKLRICKLQPQCSSDNYCSLIFSQNIFYLQLNDQFGCQQIFSLQPKPSGELLQQSPM